MPQIQLFGTESTVTSVWEGYDTMKTRIISSCREEKVRNRQSLTIIVAFGGSLTIFMFLLAGCVSDTTCKRDAIVDCGYARPVLSLAIEDILSDEWFAAYRDDCKLESTKRVGIFVDKTCSIGDVQEKLKRIANYDVIFLKKKGEGEPMFGMEVRSLEVLCWTNNHASRVRLLGVVNNMGGGRWKQTKAIVVRANGMPVSYTASFSNEMWVVDRIDGGWGALWPEMALPMCP